MEDKTQISCTLCLFSWDFVCLQKTDRFISSYVRSLKLLQLVGDCSSVQRLTCLWHTRPFTASR